MARYTSNVCAPKVPKTSSFRPASPLPVSSGSSAPRVARYCARNSSIAATAVRTSRLSCRAVSTSCRSTESCTRSSHLSATAVSPLARAGAVSYANGTRAVSAPGGSSVSRLVRRES